jgi:hypothetical protein
MIDPAPSSPTPQWAIERVQAALRLGLRVPEIEQQLITKGLTPEQATATVLAVLEGRIQQQAGPLATEERHKLLHQVASTVVAVSCVALAYWYGGYYGSGYSAVRVFVVVLGPWLCIWLSWMGSTSQTGLRLIAWLFLLIILAYRLFLVTITYQS